MIQTYKTYRKQLCTWIVLVAAALGMSVQSHDPSAQDPASVKVWEFSPYGVQIWVSVSDDVSLSDYALHVFMSQVRDSLESTFRAAWRVQVAALPEHLENSLQGGIAEFDFNSLRQQEFVLVVLKDADGTRTVRTFDAAMGVLTKIGVSKRGVATFQRAQSLLDDPNEAVEELAEKFVPLDTTEVILQQLRDGEISAALLPNSAASEVMELVRPIETPLPWQAESTIQQFDKLFFMHLDRQGADYHISVRELDCQMQFLSQTFQGSTAQWTHGWRVASQLSIDAFAPIARVEEANSAEAKLLLRAGGLILEEDNPARIHRGDVMQPIVRRDDRNGVPTLLQPLHWTYAAITDAGQSKLEANVYTYSGGPGLQGRRNRRTKRILLRTRPRFDETEIQIVTRGSGQPQSSCFVYVRDLITDQFEYLGRTDWRGRFTIPVPEQSDRFLPHSVRLDLLKHKRKVAQAIEEELQSDEKSGAQDSESEEAENSLDAGEDAPSEKVEFDTRPHEIALRVPLKQLSIKNGDTVLAKLPIVPGLQKVEVAQLTDDSRRLRAEAFIRGFQGEIIDLIGLRNLLAAKIKLQLKEKQIRESEETLRLLRQLPTFSEMAVDLGEMQQRMLDESQEEIPRGSKPRIDRMFKTTRGLLEKYLQDELVGESSKAVSAAGGTVDAESGSEAS